MQGRGRREVVLVWRGEGEGVWWLVVVEELCVGGDIFSTHGELTVARPAPLELVIRDAACYATNCPPVSWRM